MIISTDFIVFLRRITLHMHYSWCYELFLYGNQEKRPAKEWQRLL